MSVKKFTSRKAETFEIDDEVYTTRILPAGQTQQLVHIGEKLKKHQGPGSAADTQAVLEAISEGLEIALEQESYDRIIDRLNGEDENGDPVPPIEASLLLEIFLWLIQTMTNVQVPKGAPARPTQS